MSVDAFTGSALRDGIVVLPSVPGVSDREKADSLLSGSTQYDVDFGEHSCILALDAAESKLGALDGGEGGIRTHGTVPRTLAFEASTFNRSVTSPRQLILQS
jgi:hypothetical protein